jgi:hypothetical protein
MKNNSSVKFVLAHQIVFNHDIKIDLTIACGSMLLAVGVGIGIWQIVKSTTKNGESASTMRRLQTLSHSSIPQQLLNDGTAVEDVVRQDFISYHWLGDVKVHAEDKNKVRASKAYGVQRSSPKLQQHIQFSSVGNLFGDFDSLAEPANSHFETLAMSREKILPHRVAAERVPVHKLEKIEPTFSHVDHFFLADPGPMMDSTAHRPILVAEQEAMLQ